MVICYSGIQNLMQGTWLKPRHKPKLQIGCLEPSKCFIWSKRLKHFQMVSNIYKPSDITPKSGLLSCWKK